MATTPPDPKAQTPSSTLNTESALPNKQANLAKRSTAAIKNPANLVKPIAPIHRLLIITWLGWLVYRLLAMPISISVINPVSPDIIGGIVWYGLWLLPAFILTPAIIKGRSPYVLLVGSMLTLVYLGASGVTLFIRVYGSSWLEILIYGLDFALLLMINTWLFLLLKRLPSMNNVVKKPRMR